MVSIHASVKDATVIETPIRSVVCMMVSIHASVKDATYVLLASDGIYYVSIHASVKDATPCL